MRTAKRITTACLTAIMIFQALAPSTEVFAQELDAVMEASVSAACAAGNTARSVQDAVATALENADQATSDDAATTPGADAGATEGGDGSTNTDGSQDSTTDGATNGDASTEGDASQDGTTADDSAADEEQADDADADAAAQADVNYEYNSVKDLREKAQLTNITEENGTVTQIVFANEADLIKISNTNPTVYQNAVISRDANTGGAFDLVNKTVTTAENRQLVFSGFGGENAPFKGSLDMKGSTLALNHTLYNNIELNDANRKVAVTWKGTDAQPAIASKINGNDQTLVANVTVANVSADKATLKSPLLGEVDGALTLEATYLVDAGKTLAVDINSTTGNIGLLANTVKTNASFTIAKLEGLPSSGTQTVSTAKDGASAGGLIGLCGDGVTVSLANPIDLSKFTVIGKAASGGFIGKATKLTLGADNKKFTCPANVGDAGSGNVGGFIGEVSFANSVEFTGNDQIDTGDGVTLSGKASEPNGVGAAVGKLNYVNSTATVSFNGGTNGATFKSTYGNGGGNAVFGGLVGSVTGCINSKPLHIENVTTEFALDKSPNFTGGLVGWLGRDTGATLEVKNATVNCTKLCQSSKGFGGVAGCIDNASIADINGLKVTNPNTDEEKITKGAGVAAECWRSAIRLGGVTDFSGMNIAENDTVAQIALVRANAPTLVFARGTGNDKDTSTDDCWVYKRCATAKRVDDLGGAQGASNGCGQVIRLDGEKLKKDLIKIKMDEHKLEGRSATDWSWQVGFDTHLEWSRGNRTLNIKSVEDFVCLALTVQFPSLWIGVYGFGGADGSVLLGSDVTINLEGNIDLSGTGVMGLGFDSASNLQTFKGTFNGNNYTINLAIGEPYGIRGNNGTSAGNGKIYRHSRLGLFPAIGGGATVNNLTIDGVVNFDNGVSVDAGSLAATITGDAKLSGVTCETNKITCDDTFGNDVNIGGIAGSMTGAGTVSFGNSTKVQAAIGAIGASDGNKVVTLKGNTRIGGAVGYVADVTAIVNVASLEIGGEITANNSASDKKAQVGGFIGCITQGAAGNTTKVNITGLSFGSFDSKSFNMNVGKSGDAKKGAGGLLGYSWGNTIVTFGDSNINKDENSYALKTANASITANDSEELGGLVYAASGHWVINNYAIDLSGTTINAKSATSLGLLVGRGSKVKDKEDVSRYGSEPYTGLYLEDKAYWGTAYRVSGITITAPEKAAFDEWVGKGVKPNSKLMDGEWNTVVSLHTEDEKLHMEDGSGSDNSYKNRSSFGESHKTNQYVRYYYNLDRAYNNMRSNGDKYTRASVHLTTPQELLLWSACRYAPADIQKYVAPGMTGKLVGLNSSQVYIDGGKSPDQKTIDLSGYSYYPAQPGGNIYVQNVNIKFYYSDIKSKFASNKSNAAVTQHENMHCGLLRTMSANLTVDNVTLGGTIGIAVNDGDTSKTGAGGTVSGALVCRYIYGSSTSASVKQISINGLTLDGLAIDGVTDETGYAPLLINEMQTYVKLNAKNISTKGYTDGIKAATSLFGKLGAGKDPDQVSATFSLINLPSLKSNTIFTHASLLESFGYVKTGSAVYTFEKDDQNVRNMVTFGSEIDANGENNVYKGKQLWYYDEVGYGTDDNLVNVGSVKADKTGKSPQFGDYLKYVCKGEVSAGNVQYHEIKVNQRVPNLTMGCGTYGDPYAITKATELNTVAEYINTQNPSDGWEVTIAANQETLCRRRSSSKDTKNEVTYVYKQAKKTWERKTGPNTTDSMDTLDDATMHSYLQSAYYSIEPVDSEGRSTDTLVLDTTAFQGLGNQINPFRGVVVGNLRSGDLATIEINNTEGASTLSGLIPYSYGSVVSNLNIEYSGKAASIAHKKVDTSGVPGAFFGGVIGCIMGGDNIIDGVSVNASGGFSVAGTAGEKGAHLVPVGGYVGAIAGGGVIFRNSSNASGALNAWHNAGTSLYDNPYVGRVIDGYAFSELADGGSLENTDRNYRVNNLDTDDTQCIETGDTQGRYRGDGVTNNQAITTTVKDSQGLLVLSAIISSGAAGGSANTTAPDDKHANNYGTYAGSRAYLGRNTSTNKKGYKFGNQSYGKVRNANYDNVGQPASAVTDFAIATKDDTLGPGSQDAGALDQTDDSKVNSPYLVSKYATWQTGNICAAQASGMDLQFVNTDEDTDEDIDYDMTPYGTGYTGLSGRYYSNACASNKGADRDRIVPFVATINGNGATIRVGSNGSDKSDNGKKKPYDIQEYTDDDYKLTGVGALFGTVTYTKENVSGSIGAPAKGGAAAAGNSGYTVQNLNFYDCNISLRYVSYSEIATVDNNIATVATDSANEVGVGLLAGTTANANSLESYGKYSTVDMTKCSVNGPINVGGLIGASGCGARSTDKSDTTWVVNRTGGQSSPVKLYDCSYDEMAVNGGENVGGFVGKLNDGSQGGVWTTSDKDIARDSTIESTSTNPRAGGVFGFSGDAVYVNADSTTTDPVAGGKATIKNVSVKVLPNAGKTSGVGGFVGEAQSNVYAHKLVVTSDTEKKPVLGAASADPLKNVGGIVGCITDGNEFKFDSCEVSNIDIESREVSGGISGSISKSPSVACSDIVISGNSFSSSYAGGINGSLGGTPKFKISNTMIRNNIFVNRNNAWENWGNNTKGHSGGLGGDGRGVYQLVNVLFDSNDFQGKDGQGIFFGDAKSDLKIYAAGIDIKPGNGRTRDDLPPLLFDTTTDQSTVKKINTVSYVAFGDYKDTLDEPDTNATLYSDDDTSDNKTVAASPYVTTSPTSKIAVRVSDTDTTDRYLFGDGASDGTAVTIKTQAGTPVDGQYTYNNIGGRNDAGEYQNTADGFNTTTSVKKYNSNNSDGSKQVADVKDFDTLVLSGGDTTTVESYLNIVTNGGYSDAKRLNSSTTKHVTANIETFTLDKNKHFVKDATATSTVLIENQNSSQMKFRASGSAWDNERGRFNLLTVTFTEAGQSYKVQVPIIVKRMLEIDFTATFVEGSNFKSSNYSGRGADAHVLIGSGETMTGYLTWTYGQAYGTPTSYGWNTYLASGGSMGPLQKKIKFLGDGTKGTLPAGTQLTLVDTANNNKEYRYTVGANGADSVSLSDFIDANKKSYAEPWLSEEVGVAANKDQTAGTWVDATVSDATAKVGGKYYRPKTAEDVKAKKTLYTLSVPEEKPVTENFYLVVRTPSGSASVNGYTATGIGNQSVNTRVNYVLRTGSDRLDEDDHHNTASTYSIASNYTHRLEDKKSGTNQMTMDGTTYPLKMEVSDTISFGKQEYTSSDTLYYQLDSSLVNYEGGKAAGAHGYPTGTQGTYSFYVVVGDNYYTWDGSKWKDAGTKKTPAVDARDWSSKTGGDMLLVLADASGKAIDLSGIREIAKSQKSEFVITMKASLTMTEPACQAGIIASQKGGSDKYTKPNYRAYLSTHADTLSTSSNSAYNDGGAGYFRMDVGSSTIALEASKKSQLGINIDDLKSADGTIALVGTYDFSKLNGADAMISSADTVTYTLSLQQRLDDGTYEEVSGIGDYVTVHSRDGLGTGSLSTDHKRYVFTDNKGADGKFATRYENSLAFKPAFLVEVNTNVEGKDQTYANYRLVLTAHMYGGDVNDTPVNANNLDGYQHSDYVTYTLARINTEGIQHGSTTN